MSRGAEAALITAVAAVLGTLGLATHEMWRDEAHTWLLVRASPTLGALLENLGQEFTGHPRPYYVVAWALARPFEAAWALRVANLLAALGAIGLFAAAAPFTRVQRVAFAMGLFPLYQYGVIARNYAPLLLLVTAYCALRTWRPERTWLRLAALAALPHIHIFGVIFAGGLALWELRGRPRPWPALALVAASLGVGVWELWPPDAVAAMGVRAHPAWLAVAAANGFFPSFAGVPALGGPLQLAVGLTLCLLSAWVAAGQRAAFLIYAALGSSLAAFFALAYIGHRWHHGLVFVSFLVALWLGGGAMAGGQRQAVVTGMLLLHAGLGLHALARDAAGPYSLGATARREIRRRGLEPVALVGMRLRASAPDCRFSWALDEIQPILAVAPVRTAWDATARRFEPYWKHYLDWAHFPPANAEALLAELDSDAGQLGTQVVVAFLGLPPEGQGCPLPSRFRLLTALEPALDYGEGYVLYHVLLVPPGRAPAVALR